MSRIERHAELLRDRRVERRLHFVDLARHQFRAHQRVRVQIVQQAVRLGVAVRQRRMRWGRAAVDSQLRPAGDVVCGDGGEVRAVVCFVPGQVRYRAHGLDADDAFEREIGLVGERAGEVVRALLRGGDERVADEVVGPLAQVRVVFRQEGGVLRFLRVGEGQDEHVAAFFDGHFLRLFRGVACRVRVVEARVVDGEVFGPEPVVDHDKDGVEQVFEPGWVEVEEEGGGGEDHVDGVHVAVGGDFFHEDVGVLLRAGHLRGAPGLARGQGHDRQVVLSADVEGVVGHFAVEIDAFREDVGVVVVEEGEG